VEVAREPGLDATVLTHELDEFGRGLWITVLSARVIEPAAPIHNVVLLQHAKTRANGRSVCENEDLPALRRRVRRDQILEPLKLLIVDGYLVRGVLCRAEDS